MHWERVPLFLWFTGICALAMLPPALLAATDGDFEAGRPFLYGAVLLCSVTFMIALAMNNRPSAMPAREQLLALLGAFTVLPAILAWPLMEAAPGLAWLDAWLEMVSAATTTGMTMEPAPLAWSRAVHLWRAEIGWLGGLLIWVAAIAILAPLRIGGFELILPRNREIRREVQWMGQRAMTPQQRILRATATLGWVYAGLTFALWILLMVVGEMPFIALCHAMAVLSTSGISPVGGLTGGQAGIPGELVIFAFLIFAVSRRSFSRDLPALGNRWIWQEPEVMVAAGCVALVTMVLFMRHWYVLFETAESFGIGLIPRAVWGAVFTSASFLTTTGFVSEQWEIARLWSGLSTPGMVLMGLALIGGGVATSAGGVKLLRIYVLYKHGQHEISRLIHPSTVGGVGSRQRLFGREAAFIAWLFFMVTALSIAFVSMVLSLVGHSFETATVLTLAAISNTGQLTQVAVMPAIVPASLSPATKLVLAAAMALGRLETLAIIALLNPNFWRR
ncbi:TrkH family potassium uptake protein [Mangrovicoccus algicola]|uniref:TrkH family potassium uptake protein n=1 Tax=Mangrovicoccus algicola TaxID=2771008 RepID=A0A8J6YVE3_9RHOB|nr:TrkH family potassium uptake protein [Mangrovicoccus algicola]MBE3638477.1 TrkH family potassium uptake protein [Mangrovicoccus algicola]